MGGAIKITMDVDVCYSCRMCELACSFHHKRFFCPELSSIKISSDFQTGEIEMSINSTCDLCQGEAQPLCVEYCFYGALKEAE